MTEEQHIQKGFNAGYKMQQLDSKLAQTMLNSMKGNNHPYAKGFAAGNQECTKEQSKDKSSFKENYFNKIKQQTKSKSNPGKDKGIDL